VPCGPIYVAPLAALPSFPSSLTAVTVSASLLARESFPIPHHPFDVAVSTMSSAHIPNLLSSRRGPRLRGRGGGRGHGHVGVSASSRRDQTVQSTDTDAAVSRLSAVSLGYLDDPFAQYFVDGPGTRRLPIINRGVCEKSARAKCTHNLTAHLDRNLHPYYRSRYPCRCLPLAPQFVEPDETNNIPRRGNRYTVLPSPRTEQASGHCLPRS
jgi:hypothetical protein